MKKIFCLLILSILFFDNVKANTTDETIFYSNDLGTKFSEKDYKIVVPASEIYKVFNYTRY